MNRIVILRSGPAAAATVAPASSTRRAGFYAADMSVEIIFGANCAATRVDTQPAATNRRLSAR
jgi:hypothetical protein